MSSCECVALGCKHRANQAYFDKGITFHTFPHTQPERLQKWITNIRRDNWRPAVTSLLCSAHFVVECFDIMGQRVRLRSDSVPTKFPLNQDVLQRDASCKMPSKVSEPPPPMEPVLKAKQAEVPQCVGTQKLAPKEQSSRALNGARLSCMQVVGRGNVASKQPVAVRRTLEDSCDHNYASPGSTEGLRQKLESTVFELKVCRQLLRRERQTTQRLKNRVNYLTNSLQERRPKMRRKAAYEDQRIELTQVTVNSTSFIPSAMPQTNKNGDGMQNKTANNAKGANTRQLLLQPNNRDVVNGSDQEPPAKRLKSMPITLRPPTPRNGRRKGSRAPAIFISTLPKKGAKTSSQTQKRNAAPEARQETGKPQAVSTDKPLEEEQRKDTDMQDTDMQDTDMQHTYMQDTDMQEQKPGHKFQQAPGQDPPIPVALIGPMHVPESERRKTFQDIMREVMEQVHKDKELPTNDGSSCTPLERPATNVKLPNGMEIKQEKL